MQVNDKNKNRGAHGVSSSMLDAIASSSENPQALVMWECQDGCVRELAIVDGLDEDGYIWGADKDGKDWYLKVEDI